MSDLNQQQRAAATCDDGPHLVLAGPGTGKTTTLAARFVHLVHSGVAAERIMAVTFTKKAAMQLQSRVQKRLGIATDKLVIGTFHSLAGQILRRYAELVSLPTHFPILDEAAQRGVLFDLKIFWDPEKHGELTDIIARIKDRLGTPAEYAAEVREFARTDMSSEQLQRHKEIAEYFARYERELIRRQACDFADLIVHPVRLMEAREDVRTQVSARFDHILVDEYQDINASQARFLDALLLPHKNLWVVGDDDQAIYGFRGADPGYILEFAKCYPGATLHRLEQNYRSSPQIVTFASRLITHNESRHPKRLIPTTKGDLRLVIMGHKDAKAEATWIGDAVIKVLESGVPPQEVAVLCRVGAMSVAIQLILAKHGIPVLLLGTRDFWALVEVKYFVGMLLVAHEVVDSQRRHYFGNNKRGQTLLQTARTLHGQPFADIITRARAAVWDVPPTLATQQRKDEWRQHVELAALQAQQAGSVEALLDMVNEQSRALRKKDQSRVILSTIHSAKGLEWDTVFIPGFERGIVPHDYAEDVEEERRVAYVAVTRSKRVLAVSYCQSRGSNSAGPSPFLADVLPSIPETIFDWRRKDLPLPRRPLHENKERETKPAARHGQQTGEDYDTQRERAQRIRQIWVNKIR